MGHVEKMMFPIVNNYLEQSRILLVVTNDWPPKLMTPQNNDVLLFFVVFLYCIVL